MSLRSSFILITFCIISTLGCDKWVSTKTVDYKVTKISNNGEELMVPSVVFKKLFKDKSALEDDIYGIEFTQIKIKLVEKTFGVLKSSRMQFDFEEGGGVLDLDQIINPVNGSFEMNFELHHEEPVENLNVVFVNKSRQRRIDNEIWGLSCESFVDLSDFYQVGISQKKILLNTYKMRHLNLLLGDFIISYKKDGKSYISRVSFTTSKNKIMFCENEVQ